jgi:hypothetical protein
MRIAPPTPTTTPMIIFFCDGVIPELPEPPLPPFKLGEPLAVELLDAEGLLVITREMVLLPLTVTMVVTTGPDSPSPLGAAVVVIKVISLETGVGDSLAAGGGVLDAIGAGDVEVSSSMMGVGVDDGAREVLVAAEDRDGEAVAVALSAVELEAASVAELPVPPTLLWTCRLSRWRCVSASAAQTAKTTRSTKRNTDGILDARCILTMSKNDCTWTVWQGQGQGVLVDERRTR